MKTKYIIIGKLIVFFLKQMFWYLFILVLHVFHIQHLLYHLHFGEAETKPTIQAQMKNCHMPKSQQTDHQSINL